MSSIANKVLFSLIIRIKVKYIRIIVNHNCKLFDLIIIIQILQRIQLTATTPSNSAVRLETGTVEFQLSNRFENISQTTHNMKLFAKAQVDINLSLGQLIKNTVFEEAEPEFQQYAFFKTRIGTK